MSVEHLFDGGDDLLEVRFLGQIAERSGFEQVQHEVHVLRAHGEDGDLGVDQIDGTAQRLGFEEQDGRGNPNRWELLGSGGDGDDVDPGTGEGGSDRGAPHLVVRADCDTPQCYFRHRGIPPALPPPRLPRIPSGRLTVQGLEGGGMGLERALQSAPWRVGDASSRLLVDVAAGRPVNLHRALSEDELELAVRHGLIGLMADVDNPNVYGPTVALYSRLAARQGVMARHLKRVLTELHAAGVRATVLKGLHLAQWAYRNPNHRTTTDIDLLVPADDVKRAIEVLAADEAVDTIPAKTPKADKRNIPFLDPSGVRFTLDLHWDLFSYTQLRGCAAGATDWAWEHAVFVEDHPLGPVWELREEARVAFLCTHALLDHRFRLILFRDLAEVAATGPDWDAVVTFARRWSLAGTTYIALLVAVGLTRADVPGEVLAALRTRMMILPYLEHILPRTDIVRFDGHGLHPLNLAAVLIHDDRWHRVQLAAGAPVAFPHWRRRIGAETSHRPRQQPAPPPRSLMLLVSSSRRRGAEVFGERLAAGLEARGWEIDFVALERTEEAPLVSAVALTENMKRGRYDRHVVKLLRSRIRRTRPAIVLANGGATLRYAVLAVIGMKGRPKLVYASIGEPGYWLRDRAHRALQATLHSRIDLVLAVSAATRDQLIELFRMRPGRVEVAHTGVPPDFLDVPDKVESDEFRMVFLGNLSEEKGPRVALDVVSRLRKRLPTKLRFVGDGPLADELRNQAAQLGITDAVELTGSVADVRPHLAWADALLLTSQTEGFPGVVLEAAAAGTPAVAFNVGGTAETIVDGETGIVVPAGDTDGLVAAVEMLASDRPRLAAMGKAARKRVGEEFLIEHSVARHDAILSELIGLQPGEKES